jgi:hypothetical protein
LPLALPSRPSLSLLDDPRISAPVHRLLASRKLPQRGDERSDPREVERYAKPIGGDLVDTRRATNVPLMNHALHQANSTTEARCHSTRFCVDSTAAGNGQLLVSERARRSHAHLTAAIPHYAAAPCRVGAPSLAGKMWRIAVKAGMRLTRSVQRRNAQLDRVPGDLGALIDDTAR